jgi:hypothetical protein
MVNRSDAPVDGKPGRFPAAILWDMTRKNRDKDVQIPGRLFKIAAAVQICSIRFNLLKKDIPNPRT